MVSSTTGTLMRPPPSDPSKSHIENVLELTPITDIGPDIFTNTRPLWHPPGARGIYGGAAIAQSLAAAQATIPPPSKENGHATFLVHSMHCYFVLAGDSNIPVLYHVERVREGKSFMTRTVQARQRGRCIFTTTLSFVREGSAGAETVDHGIAMPAGALADLDAALEEDGSSASSTGLNGEESERGPFLAKRMEVMNTIPDGPVSAKRARQWIKARGAISAGAGIGAHLSALAYMSDSYFIGTISRVHGLWRFGRPAVTKALNSWDQSTNARGSASLTEHTLKAGTASATSGEDKDKSKLIDNYASHSPMAALEARENPPSSQKVIGMMVSLDHSIFIHRPREIRADEWLLAEMDSPWAGDGRGLVTQRIWNRNGVLVATCVQEGCVRLVQGKGGVMEAAKL